MVLYFWHIYRYIIILSDIQNRNCITVRKEIFVGSIVKTLVFCCFILLIFRFLFSFLFYFEILFLVCDGLFCFLVSSLITCSALIVSACVSFPSCVFKPLCYNLFRFCVCHLRSSCPHSCVPLPLSPWSVNSRSMSSSCSCSCFLGSYSCRHPYRFPLPHVMVSFNLCLHDSWFIHDSVFLKFRFPSLRLPIV